MAQFEGKLPYNAWGSRYLKLENPNQVGIDVKGFQTLFNLFLKYSSLPNGPMGTPLATDGIFGLITSRAAKKWQSYFGLSTDGVIGPITATSLGQYEPAYGGPRFGSRAIENVSQSGGDVWVLQNRLDCYRYGQYFGSADGDFGTGLSGAVLKFQQDMNTLGIDPGVPENGSVESKTFDALWAYTYVGGRGLYRGRNGIDALWIQRFLKSQSDYPGFLDGYYGLVTEAGVKKFQTTAKIAVDGVVGPVTMKSIGSVFNKPASIWP